MNAGASRTTPRTIDGFRVALAGLPANAGVQYGANVELQALTVGELRKMETLPHAIEVLIPYRWLPDSTVRINYLEDERVRSRTLNP